MALRRGFDPLPVEVGDRLDLCPMDDTTARSHLVVADARVLDHDDRTVTVAIPADRVSEVVAALDKGFLLGGADVRSDPQRSEVASSPRTPRPTTTR